MWVINKIAGVLFRLRFEEVIDIFKRHYNYRKTQNVKKQLKHFEGNFFLHEGNRIYNPQYMTFGNNFHALFRCRIEAIDNYAGNQYTPEIIIGNNVSINDDCHIGCIERIVIEEGVLIASKVYITDHFHGDSTDKFINIAPEERPLTTKGPVTIKKNAWIGEGVCVMPGVTIGENSIIGANAVVTKSIPANSVAAGIPARVIKTFNTPSIL